MTPPSGEPQWAAVLAAFESVADLDDAARRAHLASIGSSDPELRKAVERLLAADSRADEVLTPFDSLLSGAPQNDDPLGLVGRTVDRFRVIEALAHGGMGVVYRAEDTRLGRPIALKFPLATRYLDPAAKQRFRREARLAAGLDHPNLCPVYETGETPDGDLYYTMPLYEGETLKARLAREGRLPLAAALEITVQLTRGLGAAHGAGVVHRDLKPANVMLLPDGGVKILDFGLARASDLTLSGSWARLGTVSYMAPEQVLGHHVDHRADLWSLGVMLYEMVTGSRPFAGGHEIGVAHGILHEEAPRTVTLRPEIPPDLDDVVDTLLRKDATERPGSAEEVAASLGRIRGRNKGSPARFRIAALRLGRRVRGRAAMVGGVALLAVTAGAVFVRGRMTAGAPSVRIAVLPFDAPGESAGSRELAIGLADGIGTNLARLRGVIAPGYLTAAAYAESGKTLGQIGSELQVRAVLLGSVLRSGGRVRTDAQLVDVRDGRRLWARRYDRPAGEMPGVQRGIEQAVLKTLRIRTTAAERVFLDRVTTANGRSYEAYLRARAVELSGRPRELFQPFPEDNIRRAQSLYSRARDLDPTFGRARAGLAVMHALAAATYDTTDARREQARLEAESALRLRPDLPEAHAALASYWRLKGNRARAIEELGLALKIFPDDAELHLVLGQDLWRAGRPDDAVRELDTAMRLDPGNPRAAFQAGLSNSQLRRREDAARDFDRAIALAPDYHTVKMIKGHAYLRWYGVVDTLAAAMDRVPPDWDPDGIGTYARFTVLFVQRRFADALVMLDSSRTELSRDGPVYQPISLVRARLFEALGERERARASFATARSVLQDSVAAHPSDGNIRVSLALASAGLGRRAEAVREARRAMELVPIGSAGGAYAVRGWAVEVFAEAGELDAAFDLLELLFSMPAGREVTVAYLRVWPGFDPLRRDPRFEQLLARFGSAS